MKAPLAALLTGLFGLWLSFTAWAEPAQGNFVANQRCDAFQSIRKQTNPDDLKVQPGQRYEVVEVNRREYDWLRIRVPGSDTPLRWVSAGCGSVEGLVFNTRKPARTESGGEICSVPDQHDGYVLAATWQPGFCEHARYNGKKPECESLDSGELQISHLTLHGLWPNRQSCGKDYGHCAGPAMQLSADTLAYVRPWMPNFRYGTSFGRYQWDKHGVCQTQMDDDRYFRRAADLVRQLDQSAAGQYIVANIGGAISKRAFYEQVDADFGSGKAQNNFLLICSGQYLQEVRVALPRELKQADSLVGVVDGQFAASRARDRNECRADRILIEAGGR
ncbi:ribonuclease T2 family protein [Pseudomonas sp. TCU-HL1]|uniref:ribonuclease T2 family protein n=1 Tax=Pseudomonas sp. TCU-HL1 TaxID=1856685 RepID=UPI00083CABB5|nr:ribonuclease T(2) [Pseudomonas sp. TCU-HL1]AOE82747.1 ribonuclease T2 [Pseudomonas sp. TCU-HL1]